MLVDGMLKNRDEHHPNVVRKEIQNQLKQKSPATDEAATHE